MSVLLTSASWRNTENRIFSRSLCRLSLRRTSTGRLPALREYFCCLLSGAEDCCGGGIDVLGAPAGAGTGAAAGRAVTVPGGGTEVPATRGVVSWDLLMCQRYAAKPRAGWAGRALNVMKKNPNLFSLSSFYNFIIYLAHAHLIKFFIMNKEVPVYSYGFHLQIWLQSIFPKSRLNHFLANENCTLLHENP